MRCTSSHGWLLRLTWNFADLYAPLQNFQPNFPSKSTLHRISIGGGDKKRMAYCRAAIWQPGRRPVFITNHSQLTTEAALISKKEIASSSKGTPFFSGLLLNLRHKSFQLLLPDGSTVFSHGHFWRQRTNRPKTWRISYPIRHPSKTWEVFGLLKKTTTNLLKQSLLKQAYWSLLK